MAEPDRPEFEPPDKGQWMSLRDHFPRALTPQLTEILPHAMAVGEASAFAEYGMPARTLALRLVHGHVYVAPESLVGGPTNRLPPPFVLWLLVRLLPAFRRRSRAARRALEERPWIRDAEHWHAAERETWRAANRALQAEVPDELDAADLADHLRRVRDHAAAGYQRHFALHGPDLVPTGLLLARCGDWGVDPAEVLALLVGASPASTGASQPLDALRAAVAAATITPRTIDEIQRVAPSELEAFLADQGWRLVSGYDIDSLALMELPSLLVTLATEPPSPRPAGLDGAEALAHLRDRVPPADHAELERLVLDARATFGMRDDNGGITGAWPMGLLRRAMLAAGRRLTPEGALADAEHAVELTVDELAGLLVGGAGPSRADVVARARDRAARSALSPPPQLGPTLDVPLSVLPPAMRTMARAQFVLRDVFTAAIDERAGIVGAGIGTGLYRGRACVAADPAVAAERIEPGDVLVALGTTPAFNLALSIAGAVVVEEGGLLSHAAVIARELGIAAALGAVGAMAAILDGATVEVDPAAGTVRVLAHP